MHTIYNFLTGPMVWIAFLVFILGSLYKLRVMYKLAREKEAFIFSFLNLKDSLNSIFHHLIIPFGSTSMRMRPLMTIVSYSFHFCLLLTPIFLMAHIVLINKAWGVSWISLPDIVADVMTVLVIIACIMLMMRRIMKEEVKYVTSASDFLILFLVALPFISGFIAYHQWFNYKFFLLLHILSGEIMLMIIPFTKLSHMIYAPFTRAYIGSEFGSVRFSKDW